MATVQTLITKGFHQFYNRKSFRFGSPRTSTPTRFAPRHFVIANPPINQNLTEKRGEIAEGRRGGARRGCAKTRENRGALVIHRIFGGFLAILGKRCRRKPEKTIFHGSFPQFPQSFPQDAVGIFVGNGSCSFFHIFVRSLGFSLRLAATRALARKRAVENGEWKIDVYQRNVFSVGANCVRP